MKTRHIFLILASALMMLGLPACSDNTDAGLMPAVSERRLAVDGHDGAFTISLSAAPSTSEIKVESNTLWKVEVVCDGGWCSVDKVSGRGNESFSMILRDNMIAKRTCSVTVCMVDKDGEKLKDVPGSSIAITVTQDVSNVRIDPSSLPPFSPQGNPREEIRVVANVEWSLDVSYEGANPSRFITVTPAGGDMRDDGGGTFSGNGEASFYLNVEDNRTAADRKAYLNLRSDAGEYSMEISQLKSEYTFDVSPVENQVAAAAGGTIRFGVLSIVGWDVSTSADWISFSVPSYAEGSDSRVETAAAVAPNASGRERSAEIYFEPKDDRYQKLSLTVTQRGYDLAFAMSSSDGSAVVMEGGGQLSFDLDSRFGWKIATPSWVSASRYEGDASEKPEVIDLKVEANLTNNNRSGVVTVTPQPTGFAGGVTLDPKVLGIEPLRFSVTQFGGREAAISVPWIVDGYTQTSAVIEFNYYSPFAEVSEAGLQWRKEDASGWNDSPSAVSNPTEGTVTVVLDALDPATKYVARGYVKDANGAVKYGTVSYPFTTAGRYPSGDDNPTPSR